MRNNALRPDLIRPQFIVFYTFSPIFVPPLDMNPGRFINLFSTYMRNIFSLLLLAVADMSKVLGNSKNCAVDYAADGSGSNANKAKRTFENYGYKNVTKRLGCESGDIKRIDSYLPDNPCTPWGGGPIQKHH